jgi:4-amino-4-deoxy-L-arabinose transferase-like glycosyltransferase
MRAILEFAHARIHPGAPLMPLSAEPFTEAPRGQQLPQPSWLKDLLIVGLIALVWFCSFINLRPLMNPDEGRYAEIPREMAQSGDFVTPRLNGVKYFEKPPLLYWATALVYKVAGVSEFNARIANALIAVAGILITYAAARRLYGRAAGIWSAIVLGTCTLYYAMGQVVTMDMAVAVTISGALFSFIIAMQEPRGRKRFLLMMACYTCMALATLSKGLIGFLLPGAVMFTWTLILRKWKELLPIYLLPGAALFLLIAMPWHVLAARANQDAIKEHDFLWFYIVHEHFLRFFTPVANRGQMPGFLIPCLIGGLFPWIFFAWQSVREMLQGGWKARQERSVAWFLIIWVLLIFLFFSSSHSILIPYILPVFPAAAVLLGAPLSRMWQQRNGRGVRGVTIAFAVIASIATLAVLFTKTPKNHPEFTVHLPILKAAIGSGLAACIGVTIYGISTRRPRVMLSGVAATGMAMLVGANMVGSVLDSGSTKTLANQIKVQMKPTDEIYCLSSYPQDLPVYLQRKVNVVAYQGELQFGIEAEPELTAARFISLEKFCGEWKKPGTRYAVVRTTDYARYFPGDPERRQQIGSQGRFLLVVNQPIEKTP